MSYPRHVAERNKQATLFYRVLIDAFDTAHHTKQPGKKRKLCKLAEEVERQEALAAFTTPLINIRDLFRNDHTSTIDLSSVPQPAQAIKFQRLLLTGAPVTRWPTMIKLLHDVKFAISGGCAEHLSRLLSELSVQDMRRFMIDGCYLRHAVLFGHLDLVRAVFETEHPHSVHQLLNDTYFRDRASIHQALFISPKHDLAYLKQCSSAQVRAKYTTELLFEAQVELEQPNVALFWSHVVLKNIGYAAVFSQYDIVFYWLQWLQERGWLGYEHLFAIIHATLWPDDSTILTGYQENVVDKPAWPKYQFLHDLLVDKRFQPNRRWRVGEKTSLDHVTVGCAALAQFIIKHHGLNTAKIDSWMWVKLNQQSQQADGDYFQSPIVHGLLMLSLVPYGNCNLDVVMPLLRLFDMSMATLTTLWLHALHILDHKVFSTHPVFVACLLNCTLQCLSDELVTTLLFTTNVVMSPVFDHLNKRQQLIMVCINMCANSIDVYARDTAWNWMLRLGSPPPYYIRGPRCHSPPTTL